VTTARFSSYLTAAAAIGHDLRRPLADLERFYQLAPALQASERRRRLADLVGHAAATVPWYRERLPERYRSALQDVDLTDLPIVTKRDLRSHDAFLSETYPRTSLITTCTGGSTGEVTTVSRTTRELDRTRAHALLQYAWMGLSPDCPEVAIIGADPAQGRGLIGLTASRWLRTREINLEHLSPAAMSEAFAQISRRRPALVWGYTSLLTQLARYALESGIAAPSPQLMCNGAETMWESDRELISRAFGSPVINRYGTTDVGVIGVECRPGSGLHLHDAAVIVEVVRSGEPVKVGERGEIVITQLDNRAMPLIRFAIGDLGRLIDEPCPCGRLGLRLVDLEGRTDDVLLATGGARVSGLRVGHCLAAFPSITRFQVVQRTPHVVEVRLECLKPDATEATQVQGSLNTVFGPEVTVTIVWNGLFDLTPRNKFRRTVRLFPMENPYCDPTLGPIDDRHPAPPGA
jgi:phenylacetate-CoA ligase